MMTGKIKELSLQETMERYPRITAHIIAESLGYATPSRAARILKDAREGRENYCEWIYSCYDRNPLRAVQNAIKNRQVAKCLFCGEPGCEDWIKDKTGGASSRVIEVDKKGNPRKVKGECVHCGKEAKYETYFSKSY